MASSLSSPNSAPVFNTRKQQNASAIVTFVIDALLLIFPTMSPGYMFSMRSFRSRGRMMQRLSVLAGKLWIKAPRFNRKTRKIILLDQDLGLSANWVKSRPLSLSAE